jgi:hypothetical protein
VKAQAMRSPRDGQELKTHQNDDPRGDRTDHWSDEEADADEDDLDESQLEEDDRWDAFILDDDGDPLPEYGDFWFPD